MTYRKLLEKLHKMNEEELDCEVTIFNGETEEQTPVTHIQLVEKVKGRIADMDDMDDEDYGMDMEFEEDVQKQWCLVI